MRIFLSKLLLNSYYKIILIFYSTIVLGNLNSQHINLYSIYLICYNSLLSIVLFYYFFTFHTVVGKNVNKKKLPTGRKVTLVEKD